MYTAISRGRAGENDDVIQSMKLIFDFLLLVSTSRVALSSLSLSSSSSSSSSSSCSFYPANVTVINDQSFYALREMEELKLERDERDVG